MIIRLILCAVFSMICSSVHAQTPLEKEVLGDLKTAQNSLTAQRERQSTERQALSKELTTLQTELLTKRRQADISRRSISDQDAYLKGLRSKEYASSAVVESLNDGLRTYGLKLSTRLLPGEPADPRLEAIFQKPADPNAEILERLKVLEFGIDRLENALGGSSLSAKVSTDDATLITGQVMSFGPVRWFQSEDKSLSGSYHIARSGQVAQLDSSVAGVASALFAGEEASAPIDITGGKARALAEIKSGPIDLVKKGGAWVYPIILLALVALFCAIKKFLELRTISDPKESEISELAHRYLQSDAEAAHSQSAAFQHPISDILPPLLQVLRSGSVDLGEEILYERLIPVREKLRSWLPFIAVTAAIAPLLGLLGTVSGLIKTFSVIAIEGTGEAQSISGGISEALITTLFGLTVAIPAFMAHALLSRRAKGIEQTSERLALVFLNEVRKSHFENTVK